MSPIWLSGEMHALLGTAVVVAAFLRKIRIEEKHLLGLFGAKYEAYQRSTRALIPGLL